MPLDTDAAVPLPIDRFVAPFVDDVPAGPFNCVGLEFSLLKVLLSLAIRQLVAPPLPKNPYSFN